MIDADRPEARSLTEGVFDALRADILACRVLPGSRLKIDALAKQHAVSPGAVREALSRLSAEGLAIAEAQRGFRVAPVSADDLTDLTTARVEMEGLCLRRSIATADVGWEADVVSTFHRLSRTPEREADDPGRLSESWSQAHAAFHRALVEGCGSVWLLRLRETLYTQSERYRRLSISVARTHRDLEAEHRAIMEAALARDAELAISLLGAHFAKTTSILLAAPELMRDSQPETAARAVTRRVPSQRRVPTDVRCE